MVSFIALAAGTRDDLIYFVKGTLYICTSKSGLAYTRVLYACSIRLTDIFCAFGMTT